MSIVHQNTVPPSVQIRRERWLKQAKRFSTIHYSLGLISVFASASASFTGLLSDNPINAASLAGIGAISGGLVAFLNPLKESEKRWLAWKLLDGECLEFELRSNLSDPVLLKDKLETEHLKLVRMVRIGEGVIGGNVSAEEIESIQGVIDGNVSAEGIKSIQG
jgi:hypothetical protein